MSMRSIIHVPHCLTQPPRCLRDKGSYQSFQQVRKPSPEPLHLLLWSCSKLELRDQNSGLPISRGALIISIRSASSHGPGTN